MTIPRNKPRAKKPAPKPSILPPRTFSQEHVHPFEEKRWTQRDVAISGDTGQVFVQKAVEAPDDWSELAVKIAASKYFFGDIERGTDPRTGGRETSVKQLVTRVARTIATWGLQDGYFNDPSEANQFEEELTWLLVNQHVAFNSPVWFNLGLHAMYGEGENLEAGES